MFEPDKWLKQRKVTTLTPVDEKVSSLVEELTGEKIKGSWWGHPRANLIYNTYQRLVRDPAVLTMKLVKGKVILFIRNFGYPCFQPFWIGHGSGLPGISSLP